MLCYQTTPNAHNMIALVQLGLVVRDSMPVKVASEDSTVAKDLVASTFPNSPKAKVFAASTKAAMANHLNSTWATFSANFFGGGVVVERRPSKGMNVTVDIQISFKDSIFGMEKELSIGGRKEKLVVKIPSGIESGQGLRVAGKGEEGQVNSSGEKGPPGDLIVRVWVEEHHNFRKEGFNLVIELPIKLTTAIAGGIVEIKALNPDVDGTIELKIPTGTSHGEILRIKGKGVPYETRGAFTGNPHTNRGDLLIVTHVHYAKKIEQECAEVD